MQIINRKDLDKTFDAIQSSINEISKALSANLA